MQFAARFHAALGGRSIIRAWAVVSMAVPVAGAADGLWKPTTLMGAPTARSNPEAVWTGSKMIVWGGYGGGSLNTGGVYDPATGTWTPMNTTGAPTGRYHYTAVWTGSKMIVWGGHADPAFSNTGGIYDPATDTWTPTTTVSAPSARYHHTAIWTGSKMIVWGGRDSQGLTNTGGIYDPATDTWTPTRLYRAPSARYVHTAVWTGSRMIVWGGLYTELEGTDTGGIYDPATDDWTPTSTVEAPTGRYYHTAIWTGSKVIVWGGLSYIPSTYSFLNTGGVYDPATNTWTPTTTVEAPTGRRYQTAVWTGSRMVVWGGVDRQSWQHTGGIYDPAANTWTPTLLVGAPAPRYMHAAVWMGSKMIVWGGNGGVAFAEPINTGGAYDPTSPAPPLSGADFNGDGHPDLLWHHQVTGELYTWLLQGTVTNSGSYLTPQSFTDTNWQIRGLADFNGDGTFDVLWHHQVSGDLYVWLLDGTVTMAGTYLTPRSFADTRWQIRGVADFNGDGQPDILWHNQVTGELYVWFIKGAVVTGASYLTPSRFTDTKWQIRGVADFNSDAQPDILWHHQGNGDLYVWGMAGTVVTWGSYLSPSRFADTKWKIVNVADFDKDGNQDLLWHHQTTGDLYLWFLNGTVVTRGSYLTPSRFADTNWKVVPR